MKVFTQTYDLAKASPHRFWVAPYSDFKIGIKILAKGEVVDKYFTVKAGAVELTPDEDKIDGFTLYTLKSGDTGFVEYTIEVEDIAEKLNLTQIVTDSTVFEVGSEGGGSGGDSYTKAETDTLLSAKADKVKQVPITTRTWSTTGGWEYDYYDTQLEEDVTSSCVQLTDFIDISMFTDATVSAQWATQAFLSATQHGTPVDGNQSFSLISECTNGKLAYVTLQGPLSDLASDSEVWEGQTQGNTSCYCEYIARDIPDGSLDENWEQWKAARVAGSTKTFAYVSENMDRQAPFVLQQVEDEEVDDGNTFRQSNDIIRNATDTETTVYIEVSAVYSNELSALPGVNDTAVSALSKADTAQNTAEAALDGLARTVCHTAGGTAPEVTNIETYYETEYTQLSVDDPTWEPVPSTMYVILPDPVSP